MPTDGSGNYSLPISYFVSNGDTIQPVQHNPPFEDVAQGLTDRVMRNGSASMTADLNMDTNKIVGLAAGEDPLDAVNMTQLSTVKVSPSTDNAIVRFNGTTGSLQNSGAIVDDAGAIRLPNGSAALPSLTFIDELGANSGIYRNGENIVGISAAGADSATFSNTQIVTSVPVRASAGSAASPSHSFSGDANTGFYSVSADVLGASVGGSLVASLHSSGIRVVAGTAALPSITFIDEVGANTGLYWVGENTVGVSTAGTHVAHWNDTGYTIATTSGATTFGSVNAVKNLISGGGQIDITNTTGGSCQRLSRTTNGIIQQFHFGASLVGNHSVTNAGTTFNGTSDGDFKVDRVPIEEELDLDDIYERVKLFAYTMLAIDTRDPLLDHRRFGAIAQDIYKIEPLKQFVTPGHGKWGDPDFRPWMLDYTGLHTVLIACIMHRQRKIEARLDAAGL